MPEPGLQLSKNGTSSTSDAITCINDAREPKL